MGRYFSVTMCRTGGMAMAAEITNATMVITKISVLVGIMPDSVLRPVKMPISSSRMMVVPPCTAHTALMMAVAAVLR